MDVKRICILLGIKVKRKTGIGWTDTQTGLILLPGLLIREVKINKKMQLDVGNEPTL